MLLSLQTHLHHYVAPSDPTFQLRVVATGKGLPERGADGRPLVVAELGPLLHSDDISALPRRHALLVPLRRRSVLLLFDKAGEIGREGGALLPLPPLFATYLRHGWLRGVWSIGEDLMFMLDLRAIAMHAAAGVATQPGAHS